MAETLLPCPFCGGVAGVDKTNYYFEDTGEHAMSAFVVSCRSCGMKTAQYRTEDSAINRWNLRAERAATIEVSYGAHGPDPRFVGDAWTMHHACSACGGAVDGGDRYCKHCGARLEEEGE